ncbi:MAG: carotenoid biosynthesis protein [Cryomorphaceae bacterium]|nr:carotenoid biosynthesis protein [Cryomorphaceae bacterium]
MLKGKWPFIVIIVLHAVGIAGVLLGFRNWIMPLTPLNLLISGWIVLSDDVKMANKKPVFAWTVVVSFLIEVLGVNTGWPFGEYYYGVTLGPQLFNTPILIGLLWLLLLIGSWQLANRISKNLFVRSLLAALLMTCLDYFMEPVAVNLGFWTWMNGQIPLSNYISWFAVALALSLGMSKLVDDMNNKRAELFFLVQIVFFLVLNTFAV